MQGPNSSSARGAATMLRPNTWSFGGQTREEDDDNDDADDMPLGFGRAVAGTGSTESSNCCVYLIPTTPSLTGQDTASGEFCPPGIIGRRLTTAGLVERKAESGWGSFKPRKIPRQRHWLQSTRRPIVQPPHTVQSTSETRRLDASLVSLTTCVHASP
jgi:hypothetical protein